MFFVNLQLKNLIMTKEEKLNLLNRVFTPSAPIKERDFFIGRKRQLEK